MAQQSDLKVFFIEHYDCDAEEITNVKYYELNKISTSKFKQLDLDMTKTEVQLLSKAQAVEIKAYAVAGTIKERVEWCSQTPTTLEQTDLAIEKHRI